MVEMLKIHNLQDMSSLIPSARSTVPINSEHYFHLICFLCEILNSDHYRPALTVVWPSGS